jgi:hypothetical protein
LGVRRRRRDGGGGPRLRRRRAAAAGGGARQAAAGTATGRASWDERFLYFAFQVDDPLLEGTNATPLSRPQEDDSVAVYLQVGTNRPDAPDAATHAMVVSAAGGFTFLTGKDGALAPRPLFSIKYAVTLQGTLNRADDRDTGYTVEMAIPWEALNVTPGAGTVLGYNAVVRSRGGADLTSLSPRVRTEAETVSPARWTRLTLGAPAAARPASAEADALFAPRVANLDRPPLVDGIVRPDEWANTSRYAFAAPEKALPPSLPPALPPDVAPAPTNVALPKLALDRPLPVERLFLARYVLGFQGDPRKPTPFRGVRTDTGRFLLSDQPASGAGPWFSSDRIGWHRAQLAEMRRAGVDVALTVAGGPGDERGPADEKALLVLAAALREMTNERIPAPQVALWLDTTALVAGGGAKPDLSSEAGRAVLYQAVRRWFEIVPPEFRARVQLPVGNGGGTAAYPVFLSTAIGLASAGDGAWAEDLRRRFAADFGADATLLIAGAADFPASSALAAFLPVGSAGKGSGPVAAFVVKPGHDDGAITPAGKAATLLPRRNGETYRRLWETALETRPTWLILDSWNDWARGTAVAPSRQYGDRYLDLTRILALSFNGLLPRDIKWLGHNAPRRVRPGEIVSTEVLLQNAGTTPLRGAEGMALSYRWLRNGAVAARSPLRVPLEGTLFPTQTGRLSVGLAAVRADETGKLQPLPPGEYVVRIDMTQAEPAAGGASASSGALLWFGENGDRPLEIPVTVTPEASGDRVTFDSVSTPTLMHAGGAYPVTVRLRWMGPNALPADAATLTYQLLSPDGARTVATGTFPLSQALPPGQWVTLRAPLRLSDNGGGPLPAVFPERLGGGAGLYRLRWLLTRTQATSAIAGVYVERVAVYPNDASVRILPPTKPPEAVDAGALVPFEVTVVNRGTTKWAKGEVLVGAHWYHPDGVEAVWKPLLTAPTAQEVEPGRSVMVSVPVRVPDQDGLYVLAFDAQRGGEGAWLSTRPITGTGDLGLVPLRVRGGRLRFVDLGRWFDTDAVASEEAPGDGDLDGKGATLPAEYFPPDRFGLGAAAPSADPSALPPYPSGYYADVSPTARRISFRYGPQAAGRNNAVAARGQVIPVPGGRYVGLHVAALATGGEDRPLALVLRFKDGTTQPISRAVNVWNRPPAANEPVALLAHRRRTASGDVAGVAALRHVIVPVPVTKELVSVTLPDDPAIKVFAMTLER